MNDQKSNEIDTSFADRINPDPSKEGDLVAIAGIPGKAADASRLRVYLDAILNRHIELSRQHVAHFEQDRKSGVATVFIVKDAPVSVTESVGAAQLYAPSRRLQLRKETIASIGKITSAMMAEDPFSRSPFCGGGPTQSHLC